MLHCPSRKAQVSACCNAFPPGDNSHINSQLGHHQSRSECHSLSNLQNYIIKEEMTAEWALQDIFLSVHTHIAMIYLLWQCLPHFSPFEHDRQCWHGTLGNKQKNSLAVSGLAHLFSTAASNAVLFWHMFPIKTQGSYWQEECWTRPLAFQSSHKFCFLRAPKGQFRVARLPTL